MGSGFRTFAASEVLTSSNVQNYLMDQAVTVHSGTAVLATAIPSPEAGMVAYVDSGDSSEGLYTHNGVAWRKGPGWNAPWGVVASQAYTSTKNTTGTHNAGQANGLTVTFNAINNRYLRITSTHNFTCTGGANGVGYFHRVGGTQIMNHSLPSLNSSTWTSTTAVSLWTTTATASLTIDVYFAAYPNNTAINDNATASWPRWLIVEDIGPAGSPV